MPRNSSPTRLRADSLWIQRAFQRPGNIGPMTTGTCELPLPCLEHCTQGCVTRGEDKSADDVSRDDRDSAKDVGARNPKPRKSFGGARSSSSSPSSAVTASNDSRPQNARTKRMEERWTHDKFSPSAEEGGRQSPFQSQRRNNNNNKVCPL